MDRARFPSAANAVLANDTDCRAFVIGTVGRLESRCLNPDPCAVACGKRYPRERGRPWTDLDAAYSLDHERSDRSRVRQEYADERPGQHAELATTYVMLAEPLSRYVSGATVPVTGGKPTF